MGGRHEHIYSPPGVFLCRGPGIRQNYRVAGAHVFDVAPTVLHLLGLPMGEDFDGEVLSDILLDGGAVETVVSYETGRRGRGRATASDWDDWYREKLTALGYTQ